MNNDFDKKLINLTYEICFKTVNNITTFTDPTYTDELTVLYDTNINNWTELFQENLPFQPTVLMVLNNNYLHFHKFSFADKYHLKINMFKL